MASIRSDTCQATSQLSLPAGGPRRVRIWKLNVRDRIKKAQSQTQSLKIRAVGQFLTETWSYQLAVLCLQQAAQTSHNNIYHLLPAQCVPSLLAIWFQWVWHRCVAVLQARETKFHPILF